MKQNRLFARSRWRLASWYAGILSIILLSCALGVYEAVAHAHRITINQELKSVGGTLHDSLLPVLKQPGKLEPEVNDLLPNTCLVGTGCYNSDNLQSYRLGAIQATAQANLMLPTLPENKARDTLKKIVRQNKRLSYLLTDLLTLCRLDGELNTSTHNKIVGDRISLPNLITEVVEELAALAMASEIELTSQIKGSKPIEVIGDRQQLYRLVTNLVTNAIQYTSAGGRVILSLTEEHHDAVICVRDTGVGISKTEQKRIFDRFYRVDKARSRSQGGSGLGLSIAKAIALAHHGSLEVQSEIGKGSNFTIRLPKCN